MPLDPLRNPKDPLHKSGPEAERELFRAMSDACHGYPSQAAVGAALNVAMNAIRQQHAKRADAERAMREVMGRMMATLCDQHYDLQGNRRNVFPFHQVVEMPLIDLRAKH